MLLVRWISASLDPMSTSFSFRCPQIAMVLPVGPGARAHVTVTIETDVPTTITTEMMMATVHHLIQIAGNMVVVTPVRMVAIGLTPVPRTRARTLPECICRRNCSQWERKVWHVRNPIIGVRNQIMQQCRVLIFFLCLGLVWNDSVSKHLNGENELKVEQGRLTVPNLSELAWGRNPRLLLVETISSRRWLPFGS